MESNSKYQNEIQAYVHDKMTASERKDFEKVLASNPELKSEVELMQSMKESFERKDVYDFKKKLDRFSQINDKSQFQNERLRQLSIIAQGIKSGRSIEIEKQSLHERGIKRNPGLASSKKPSDAKVKYNILGSTEEQEDEKKKNSP